MGSIPILRSDFMSEVPSDQLGFRILHEGADAVVDVVAVHGLGAIPEITWKEKKSGINWLEDKTMLPSAVPNARIMAFGYDSMWLGRSPVRTNIQTIAKTLLNELDRERKNFKSRPLIFIGHCFGGLVIQRALAIDTLSTGQMPGLVDSTVGVIFLGTPHSGTVTFTSRGASTKPILAVIALYSELRKEPNVLRDLESEDNTLLSVSHDFLRLCQSRNLQVINFFEERISSVGKQIGRDDIQEFVVDEESAKLGSYPTYGLPLDHYRLNKFGSPHDGNFKAVQAQIQKLYISALDRGRTEENLVMQQAPDDLDQIKQEKLRRNIHKWLSPPDPSTNHNIACDTYHKKTATWFIQGSIFQEWKSRGSLLWIHGKPGSGKSILCSTIIQDIEALCKVGEASMAYFYFDFQNANKQYLHDLVPSLLNHLSARSKVHFDILSNFYSTHDKGRNQPRDSDLAGCLKEMLTLPDQRPIYLIMDALDESPDTPGIPSPRKRVVLLVKELFNLCLPNLHICVTSRPDIGIRKLFEPLTPREVSLHDQSGQNDDIANYVRSVVYSDSEENMKAWSTEDKELVINSLSERADGMFRWAFCLLEILRDCLSPNVRHALSQLPKSLDETYERVLKEIKEPNRDHARRLFSCLVAAVRPLRKEELVEVIAVNFDDAEGIPKLNPSWRCGDEEQALLSSCSSLIAIVDTGRSRVVRFSHFSVQEFLTSARIATSSQDVSRYHIDFKLAHTVLAQACLSILLCLDNLTEQSSANERSPLVGYAAEHWVHHAQFEDVALSVKGMEYLFDLDKPYFTAWCRLHDIDTRPSGSSVFFQFAPIHKSGLNTPLYYAALCGFASLVEQLIVKHPQHVLAIGGYYMTPAVAALAGRHFQLAQLLHEKGSSVDPRGVSGRSPLHSAAYYGDLKMVQVLLNYGVDVNAQSDNGSTPLYFASWDHFNDPNPEVVRLLLRHDADPNIRAQDGTTPLHQALQYGWIEIARLLVEHGASVDVEDEQGRTPLDVASGEQREEIIKLLIEHRA